ncbi:MAG: dihydrolipoyl dehydrogenase [Deltaproteobacteria bacterium]|nr:dihydrolipoyl dehydrogenase [Deltaproteobacteria bacterium]
MVMGTLREETELAIVGGGPGGYVAAIRAADLGREVLLVDERPRLGGTCLLEGCIPSKALIHAVGLLDAAREAEAIGLRFAPPVIDLPALRKFVEQTVAGLAKGVDALLERRGVHVVRGRARFTGAHSLLVEGEHQETVEFRQAIVATGSRVATMPAAGDLPVWTSTEALGIPEVPERLIVVGGGYIGLELGQVYAGLGSKVTVVEFAPRMLAGADPDLVEVVVRRANRSFAGMLVDSKVVGMERTAAGFAVTVEHEGARRTLEAERVLVAVGRTPNTDDLGLGELGLAPDAKGRLAVSEECRTAVPHVFAIGDIVPGPMLAHKATREAKIAAEVISHHKAAFDNRAIPAVVYTDPEIAWAGLTEREAQEGNLAVTIGRFPLRALGRARTLGRTEGFVKILTAPDSGLVLGVGMVGPQASELIAEATLALEMGATLEDLLVTIHPHPTLSEAILEAAEVAAGSPVHVNPPKAK